jgi:hypothetical protein
MYSSLKNLLGIVTIAAAVTMSAPTSNAASVAVFGDNSVAPYLSSLGDTVSLVTNAQLATAGFINTFDAFFMTRDGSSFGVGLSAAAAANVAAYVGSSGNVVLLNGDFADSVGAGDANVRRLVANATAFAASSGHGFVGELNGAVSGLTANGNGFTPIGLITGTAGAIGIGGGGADQSMVLTAAGVGDPVTAGVTFPYNPPAVEFGAPISGVDSSLILARWGSTDGSAAIIVRGAAAVPEVSSVLLLATLVMAVAVLNRRRLTAKVAPALSE